MADADKNPRSLATEDVAGVRSSLSELDGRLRDLKREITRLSTPPTVGLPEASNVSASREGPVATPGRQGAVEVSDLPASIPATAPPPLPPDLAHAPQSRAPDRPVAVGAGRPPESSTPQARHDGASPSVQQPIDPAEIVARAEEQAARILAQAHQRADELKTQIEQLLELRERLRISTREVVRSYDDVLEGLERAFESSTPARQPPAGSPETGQQPPQTRFSGAVNLVTGPLADLDAIRVLEDSLCRILGVQKVYIRSFDEQRAQVELQLAEETDLLSELERVLPFSFEYESAAGSDVVLRLTDS